MSVLSFTFTHLLSVNGATNLSVEIISGLIFVNRNSTALCHDTPIDVFGGLLDPVTDIVDDMEINPYAFADASDAEKK